MELNLENIVKPFFYRADNKLVGNIISDYRVDEKLGHIINKNKLYSLLNNGNKFPDDYDASLLEDNLDEFKIALGNQTIKPVYCTMWSFRDKNNNHMDMPGKPTNDLPCILGLTNANREKMDFIFFKIQSNCR